MDGMGMDLWASCLGVGGSCRGRVGSSRIRSLTVLVFSSVMDLLL